LKKKAVVDVHVILVEMGGGGVAESSRVRWEFQEQQSLDFDPRETSFESSKGSFS
jgi:hypothetical protein